MTGRTLVACATRIFQIALALILAPFVCVNRTLGDSRYRYIDATNCPDNMGGVGR